MGFKMARKNADTLPALQARIDQLLCDRISSLMGQVKSIRSISDQIAATDIDITRQEKLEAQTKSKKASAEIAEKTAPMRSLRTSLISELADLTKIIEES